jgi:hypothetical protein
MAGLLTHHTGVDARRFYGRRGFAPGQAGMTLQLDDIAILRQPDCSALMNAVLAAIAKRVLPFVPVNAR